MPADTTLPQEPSERHGDARLPYPCHTWSKPPKAPWGLDFGYCRTSLDSQPPHARVGSSDTRCPRDCPHKAPYAVVTMFVRVFQTKGAKAAAECTRLHREKHRP